VTHCEPLSDGRYNMVLRGLEKFRVTGEDSSKPYRLARIDSLPEEIPPAHREEVRKYRTRLEALLAAAIERSGADPKFPPAVPDEDLVNALAQYLQLEAVERQALLERDGVLERCRGLIELLEMKTMTPRGTSWKGHSIN
jgi:Lon protease-like protein